MAKFSSIARGVRARKAVTFPLLGGGDATCAVVPLLAEQEVAVLAQARAFAISKGLTDPKDGQPLYELSKWVHTLVHACVDVDSPLDDPAPFFDGGAAQILHPKEGLDRDRIALLYQEWMAWQDECSPPPGTMTGEEYMRHLLSHSEVADGAELPFVRWRPIIQQAFVRTMASQLSVLLGLRSLSGSISPESMTSSENSSSQ